MHAFIQLTGLSDPPRPIRIRADRIDWMESRRIADTKRPYEERSTFTAIGVGDATFMVVETPEEIDRLIEEAVQADAELQRQMRRAMQIYIAENIEETKEVDNA